MPARTPPDRTAHGKRIPRRARRCRGLTGTLLLGVLAGLFATSLVVLDQGRARDFAARRATAAARHDAMLFKGFDAWLLAHQPEMAARLAALSGVAGGLVAVRWPGADGPDPDPFGRVAGFGIIADPSGRQIAPGGPADQGGPLPVAVMVPGALPATADRPAFCDALTKALGRCPAPVVARDTGLRAGDHEEDDGRARLIKALTGRPARPGETVLRSDRDIRRDARFLYRLPIPGQGDLAWMQTALGFENGARLRGAATVRAQHGESGAMTAARVDLARRLVVSGTPDAPYAADFAGPVTGTGALRAGTLEMTQDGGSVPALTVSGSLRARTTAADRLAVSGEVTAGSAQAGSLSSTGLAGQALTAPDIRTGDLAAQRLTARPSPDSTISARTVETDVLQGDHGTLDSLETQKCYGCRRP